eukprot:1129622_1
MSQTRRSRKRRLERNNDSDEGNGPSVKRRRISHGDTEDDDVKFDSYVDDEVEPYSDSEVDHLKVTELKKLLRDNHFPVSGNKAKLIKRLKNPRKTIKEMKRSYHKKFPRGCRVPEGTSQRTINRILRDGNRFDENNYYFKNGKINRKPIRF